MTFMTADELLDRLEQERLVKGELVANLRGQVKQSAKPVAAATIAKLLVDKGLLTGEQSQQLLTAAAPQAAAAAAAPPLDDFLGLAPLDDEPLPNPPAPAKPSGPPKPADKPVAAKPAAGKPAKQSAPASAAVADALEPLDDLQPLDGLQALDGLDPLGDPLASPAAAQPLADLSSGGDLFGASLGDPLAAGMPASSGPAAASPTAAALPPGATVVRQAPAAAKPKRPGLALAISGGIFAMVVIGTAAAVAMIPKPTGDAEFAAAEADYQAQQYSAAVPKYADFVQRFSYHPQIGAARIHQAWSRIQAADGSKQKDWGAILPVAKETLTAVGGEPQLAEVHAELAPLLTDMAVSLVDEARRADGDKGPQISLAKDALALANDSRFIPGNLRDWQRLATAEEALALIEHDAGRSAAIAASAAAMKQALAAKDTAAVYAARAKALAAYPAAAQVGELRDSMQQAAALEGARVQPVADAGQRASAASGPAIELLPDNASASGGAAVFSIAGAAWGVDSASGQLRWRAPTLGWIAPAYLPDGDVLLIDFSQNELVRVKPAGEIAWRFSLDAPVLAVPLVAGQRAIVASTSGRVVALDLGTGAPAAAVQLPQAVRATPAFDPATGNVYVAAESHHVYVLSAADLSNKATAYVGHEAGADVAPVIAGGRLLIAANSGASSTLFVQPLNDAGMPQGPSQQERLGGTLASPPAVLGAALAAVTDRTTVVFELPASPAARLKRLGEASAAGAAVASGDRLWIGGDGLRQYSVAPSGGLLTPVSASFPDSVLIVPPQMIGGVLIGVRTNPGQSGNLAFALQTSDAKRLWETPLTISKGPTP